MVARGKETEGVRRRKGARRRKGHGQLIGHVKKGVKRIKGKKEQEGKGARHGLNMASNIGFGRYIGDTFLSLCVNKQANSNCVRTRAEELFPPCSCAPHVGLVGSGIQ